MDPPVASFAQLRENPGIAHTGAVVMNITKTLIASQEYDQGKRDKKGYYTSPLTYQSADPAGIASPDNPLFFPAVFDFAAKDEILIGLEDDSYVELSSDPNNGIPMMMYLLGAAHINVKHEYRLENIDIGKKYQLEIGLLGNTLDAFQLLVNGEGVGEISSEELILKGEDKKIIIQFKALEPNGKLFLSHFYKSGNEYLLFDYIRISKINGD